MELTVGRKDALTELINIGYGRAAGALSELTGYRITLEVPKVAIHEIEAMTSMLENMLGSKAVSVNQVFAGPVAGNAMLLLNEASALALSQLLSGQHSRSQEFDSNTEEIITEIGNILLNACLGVFGNLLNIQVSFSVPHLYMESVAGLLQSLMKKARDKLQYGLMIHTRFRLKTDDVTGFLVIVLGISSLDRLMQELDAWETRQLQ